VTLLDRHVAFVAALREAGVRVSVAEGLDAFRALEQVELLDRDQFRVALAASLVKRQQQRAQFDTVFDLFYPPVPGDDGPVEVTGGAAPPVPRGNPLDDPVRTRLRAQLADYLVEGDDRALEAVARESVAAFGAVPGRRAGEPSWSRLAVLSRVSPETLMAQVLAAMLRGERGGIDETRARTIVERRIGRYTDRVAAEVSRLLAAQSDAAEVARSAVRPAVDEIAFLGAGRADLARMRREIQPLARKLASRLTLQQRRGSRGTVEFRRTIRAALSTGGVPVDVALRPKRPGRTDLVVLCDLSESVSAFAQFTLLFVYALREQFGRVRAFGFVDELEEVTRFFTPGGDVLDTVARLTAEADVVGLLGRTDYGRAIELFARRFPDAIGPRTSLLVLGDARSNYGDVALPTLRRLTGRARHAYWLNPERRALWDTGDSRAGDFAGVMPMVECRNLRQLSAFVGELAPVRR